MCFLFIFLLSLISSKEGRNVGSDIDRRQDLEKGILDNWAKSYVREFFSPSVVSKAPVKLGKKACPLRKAMQYIMEKYQGKKGLMTIRRFYVH